MIKAFKVKKVIDKNININVSARIAFDGYDASERDFYEEFELGEDITICIKGGKIISGKIAAIGLDYLSLYCEERNRKVKFENIVGIFKNDEFMDDKMELPKEECIHIQK